MAYIVPRGAPSTRRYPSTWSALEWNWFGSWSTRLRVKSCMARCQLMLLTSKLTNSRTPQRQARGEDLGRRRLVGALDGDDDAVGGDLGDAAVSYQSTAQAYRALVWTVISERANFFSAYSEIFSE